ncbi:MAG TPA: class II fructose-bisphosphate aldolase, partial [Candidatus Paceibacterota bacterium]
LSFSENVDMVKKAIAYSKETGKDIVVEGELGFIGTSSEILEKIPPGVAIDEAHMTSAAEAEKFVKETGVDLLAPAVGNVHGIIRESGNPPLSIKRVGEIRKSAGIPLVLHGASGIADKDVADAVKAGAAIVHFSTDIRVAFRRAAASALNNNQEEMSPYKYLREAIKAVKDTVKTKIDLIS